ncbi:MAG: thioredoxin family protein [Erysipelotrichaceae bacterium]|nr:thioredoxin family protein [Erysipelotrichaceae bacterium]
MKKILLCLMLVLLVGCTGTTDAQKFKKEYEALNGQSNDAGVLHKTIEISENNPMIYATDEEVITMLESGTGIIYFGFPDCPWCRAALPVLLEAAEEELMTKIYYLNNKEQRDTREALETGGSVVTKDGTSEYYRIVNALGEHASVYEGMGDDSIKRLYYPTVVFVHEGEIVGVQVSLASEEGVDPRKDLTSEQWNDLKTIYKEYMRKVKGSCDSSC